MTHRQGGKRIFISFEYGHDNAAVQGLLAEAKRRGYPAPAFDLSLSRRYDPNDENWVAEARKSIKSCQLVVVYLGPNTHSSSGVKREIQLALKLGKQIIHIKPQGSEWKAHPLLPKKPVVVSMWKNLDPIFDSNYGKHDLHSKNSAG